MNLMKKNQQAGATPRYRIGAVTRLTGLSADVVRVWERRYQVINPSRSAGGSRLYSETDVARLRQLRQVVERGYTIGQAAKLSASQMQKLLGGAKPKSQGADPYALVRARFLEAIERIDVVAADLELSRAATLFPPQTLVKNIIAPTLTEVGERWSHKEFGVAHERLASGLVRNLLCSLFRLYPPTAFARTLVLAAPVGERHEFGLLLCALLAATQGWRVLYLGPDLPVNEIIRVIRLSGARLLALSLVAPDDCVDIKELERLARSLPAESRVLVGGAEAARHANFFKQVGWTLLQNLDDFEERLRRKK
jgi:DNA-binding transcriptional MerR regulator